MPPTDSWDGPDPLSLVSHASQYKRNASKSVPKVRDDWDDDDDEDDEPAEPAPPPIPALAKSSDSNIWNSANASSPMPRILAQSALPAAAALSAQASTMRILKRSETSSPSLSGSASPLPTPTSADLAARQAQYDAARQRIFASHPVSNQDPSVPPPAEPSPHSRRGVPSSIVRLPRGPDGIASGSGEEGTVSPLLSGGTKSGPTPTKGFSRRRGGGPRQPPSSSSSPPL